MVHEHLYYPAGPGVYGQLGESFIRLYLAGGVTTMRTGGNVNGFMDLKLKRLIDAGQKAGPAIDATAPYLEWPEHRSCRCATLKGPDDARQQVAYWADEGATSFKAYMQIRARRARRGNRRSAQARLQDHRPPLFGDLRRSGRARHRQPRARVPRRDRFRCRQAARRLPGAGPRTADHCCARRERRAVQGARQEARRPARGADVDADGVRNVHARPAGAAGTRRAAAAAQGAVPADATRARRPASNRTTSSSSRRRWRSSARSSRPAARSSPAPIRPAAAASSRATRISGSSSCSSRPGSPRSKRSRLAHRTARSISAATRRVGTIAVGKQADLVVVNGDPSANIADVRNVEIVFKQGVGFDPAKLIESVKGKAGLW